MGGNIRDVDLVRDEFTLKVFGGSSIKILFDERTQVFRDGHRFPVLGLQPENHASVETTLDGTKVFARRIHILSELPEGECRGRIISYSPRTGELAIEAALSQSITLRIVAGTTVTHSGQPVASSQQPGSPNFVVGSLVDVKFMAGSGSHGVATHIDIVASPGEAFVFRGKLATFDMHAGRIVIVDTRDNQSYDVAFDPSRFPMSRELHNGLAVKVITNFDGQRFVASKITVE